MPFNAILLGGQRRTFRLTLSVNNSTGYDVEGKVLAAFGQATRAGDLVILTLSGSIEVIGFTSTGYAIDGHALHNSAELSIVVGSGVTVAGKGGKGGNGGSSIFEPEPSPHYIDSAGGDGAGGGTAIRCGCKTRINGSGTIRRGFPGGGGGGAKSTDNGYGGCGGGGGASYGDNGTAGTGGTANGTAGNDGTLTGGGAVQAGGANNPDSGRGADNSNAATAGAAGSPGTGGGSAGPDTGNAITTQGFSCIVTGVTVIGPVV